jgi:hypothetical protein
MRCDENNATEISRRARECVKEITVAAFTASHLWVEARWSATTFRWHPTSGSPPVMGIVFENGTAGKQLFRDLENQYDHADRLEAIRVSIIDGFMPGQSPGYSVHICPDPIVLAKDAKTRNVVLDPSILPFIGQWNRMYPIPGSTPLLSRFKEEFDKHKEFLLAPVTRRADGQNYVDAELGIVKRKIEFRQLSEISAKNDIDAMASMMPTLIPPRES